MKSKGIFLILGIIIITCIGIAILFIVKNSNRNISNDSNNNKSVEEYNSRYYDPSKVDRVINISDISDSDFKLKEEEVSLANKYNYENISGQVSEDNIELGNLEGKAIFVRNEDTNLNVFQATHTFNKDEEDVLGKINKYMKDFLETIYSVTNIDYDAKPTEKKLYGKSKYKFEIPIEESIYVEKRLYSLKYDVKDKKGNITDTYDVNFYMNGDTFVCELVKTLK